MRFLVDECLPTRLALLLGEAGYDAIHVVGCRLAGTSDARVLAYAAAEAHVLLSADTDFGEILARSGGQVPSVTLFRRADRSAASLASVLLTNLDLVADDLERGAFVVITENRLRIRRLPLA